MPCRSPLLSPPSLSGPCCSLRPDGAANGQRRSFSAGACWTMEGEGVTGLGSSAHEMRASLRAHVCERSGMLCIPSPCPSSNARSSRRRRRPTARASHCRARRCGSVQWRSTTGEGRGDGWPSHLAALLPFPLGNGGTAAVYTVFARTPSEDGGSKLTAFIVERAFGEGREGKEEREGNPFVKSLRPSLPSLPRREHHHAGAAREETRHPRLQHVSGVMMVNVWGELGIRGRPL